MSTLFTSVYDSLRAQVAAVLPSHNELNNAYIIEDDTDLDYDNAWALAIGPSINTNRNLCPKITIQREFVLTLTHRYYASEIDTVERIAAEKEMFNYQLDALKGLVNYTTSDIINIQYQGDNGLEFLEGEREGFILLQTILQVEYFESL